MRNSNKTKKKRLRETRFVASRFSNKRKLSQEALLYRAYERLSAAESFPALAQALCDTLVQDLGLELAWAGDWQVRTFRSKPIAAASQQIDQLAHLPSALTVNPEDPKEREEILKTLQSGKTLLTTTQLSIFNTPSWMRLLSSRAAKPIKLIPLKGNEGNLSALVVVYGTRLAMAEASIEKLVEIANHSASILRARTIHLSFRDKTDQRQVLGDIRLEIGNLVLRAESETDLSEGAVTLLSKTPGLTFTATDGIYLPKSDELSASWYRPSRPKPPHPHGERLTIAFTQGDRELGELRVSLEPDFQDREYIRNWLNLTAQLLSLGLARIKERASLKANETRYRNLLEGLGIGYFELDPGGHLTWYNRALRNILSAYGEEILGLSYKEYVDAETQKILSEAYNNSWLTGKPAVVNGYSIYRPGTATRQVSSSALVKYDSQNQKTGFHGIIVDETERYRAEAKLRESEGLFRALAEASPVPILFHQNDRWVYVNEATRALTGYAPEQMIGTYYWEIVAPEFQPLTREMASDRTKGQPTPRYYETEIICKNQTRRKVRVFGKPIYYQGDRATVVSVIDITEEQARKARIEFLAYHDSLTGLLNRHGLVKHLKNALADNNNQDTRLTLVTCDINHFGQLNSYLGTDASDQILKAIARRIRHIVANTKNAARIGADEFALVLVSEPEDKLDEQLSRVQEELKQPYWPTGKPVVLDFSIGISRTPVDAKNASDLIRRSGLALAKAKQNTLSNPLSYSADLELAQKHEKQMEQDLTNALQQNMLVLYFQPKVRIRDGKIIGCEALARWPQPDGTLLPPSRFIPLAERLQLIEKFGLWALQNAIQTGQLLRSQGTPISIAVNVSARELANPKLVDELKNLLSSTDYPANLLELEITETFALQRIPTYLETLEKIKKLGLNIVVDDFGTGYASMEYLNWLPMDALKIDRTFIGQLGRRSSKRAIQLVQAIIDLGQVMGLTTIAEGVETAQQAQTLAECGCEQAQGYYYSKPLPAGEFLRITRHRLPHAP